MAISLIASLLISAIAGVASTGISSSERTKANEAAQKTNDNLNKLSQENFLKELALKEDRSQQELVLGEKSLEQKKISDNQKLSLARQQFSFNKKGTKAQNAMNLLGSNVALRNQVLPLWNFGVPGKAA